MLRVLPAASRIIDYANQLKKGIVRHVRAGVEAAELTADYFLETTEEFIQDGGVIEKENALYVNAAHLIKMQARAYKVLSSPGNITVNPFYHPDTSNSLFQYTPPHIKKYFNRLILNSTHSIGRTPILTESIFEARSLSANLTAIIAINNAIMGVTSIPEGVLFEEGMEIPITQSIHSVQVVSRLINTLSDLSSLYYGKLPLFRTFVQD